MSHKYINMVEEREIKNIGNKIQDEIHNEVFANGVKQGKEKAIKSEISFLKVLLQERIIKESYLNKFINHRINYLKEVA